MAIRTLLVFLALFLPVVMTLAYLDPPDPPWVSGFWDNDDHDAAVDAILNSYALAPSTFVATGPGWKLVVRLETLDANRIPVPVGTSDSPRGPPKHAA